MTRFIKYPPDLKSAKNSNELVPFIGAGLSMISGGSSWMLMLEGALDQIKAKIGYEARLKEVEKCLIKGPKTKSIISELKSVYISSYDPLLLSQLYENSFGRHAVITFLQQELKKIKLPTKTHDLLFKVNKQVMVTTNYDNLIEQTAKRLGLNYRTILKEEDVPFWSDSELKIIKMHGSLIEPFDSDSIVFTRNDYEAYGLKRPSLSLLINFIMTTKSLLLIGYSARDPDFLALHDIVRLNLKKGKRNIYLIVFDAPQIIMEYWMSYGFYPINLDGKDKEKSLNEWLVNL